MSLHEVIDSRVLGAFRLIDHSTQAVIKRPLNVSATDTTFIRNRSYHYVISDTAGLEQHTEAFSEPPPTPPLGDIDLDVYVHDPMHRYLPRITAISLPRDPLPENADEADSLFQPVAVQMYAAPTFPMHPNWSGIRASLSIEGSEDPVPGALLRVIRTSDDAVLARGISDQRGEALVIIPGIPITNFSTSTSEDDEDVDASGPVVISETAARVEVIVDDALPWPVNPDVLEANRASWIREGDEPILLTLRTGQIETINIEVDLS
jgi:hypothetical protein